MILFLFVIMMVQIQVLPSQHSDPALGTSLGRGTSMTAAVDMPVNPVTLGGRNEGTSWWTNLIRGVAIILLPMMGFFYITWNPAVGQGPVNYFYPAWTTEFKTMTDLETLANLLYLGYPTALILIGIALWVVMIGIIKVTTPD